MDIIVTTPKKSIENAKLEAADALAGNVHYYFRVFNNLPKVKVGDRVFYVENGSILGYAVIHGITDHDFNEIECSTNKTKWKGKVLISMKVDSWKWIKPIKMDGFQGYRYLDFPEDWIKIIGHWKDPKPEQNGL